MRRTASTTTTSASSTTTRATTTTTRAARGSATSCRGCRCCLQNPSRPHASGGPEPWKRAARSHDERPHRASLIGPHGPFALASVASCDRTMCGAWRPCEVRRDDANMTQKVEHGLLAVYSVVVFCLSVCLSVVFSTGRPHIAPHCHPGTPAAAARRGSPRNVSARRRGSGHERRGIEGEARLSRTSCQLFFHLFAGSAGTPRAGRCRVCSRGSPPCAPR